MATAGPVVAQGNHSDRYSQVMILANWPHFAGLAADIAMPDDDWAVHLRFEGPVALSRIAVAGVRRTLRETPWLHANASLAVGLVGCNDILDEVPDGCGDPNQWEFGGGGSLGAAVRLGRNGDWAIGPEIGYWRALEGGPNQGFDIWTFGLALRRRIRHR